MPTAFMFLQERDLEIFVSSVPYLNHQKIGANPYFQYMYIKGPFWYKFHLILLRNIVAIKSCSCYSGKQFNIVIENLLVAKGIERIKNITAQQTSSIMQKVLNFFKPSQGLGDINNKEHSISLTLKPFTRMLGDFYVYIQLKEEM